jgi:predicted esterase
MMVPPMVLRLSVLATLALVTTPALAHPPCELAVDPPVPNPAVGRIAVAGHPDAFFVAPEGEDDTSLAERRVFMVLHARHGDPEADCAKWATVAAIHGWVLCPSGPVGADGDRSWGKFDGARAVIDDALDALRARFGARVRATDNLLIGFSEGALMAQILGITEPERWSRWLILAGSNTYWGDDDRALEWLRREKRKIVRVVMLTGEHDLIKENTLRAGALVRAAHIPVRVIVRQGLGHEVPADRMAANYQASLRWLLEAP